MVSAEIRNWCRSNGAKGGVAGRGKPKRYSQEEIARRTERLVMARIARLKEPFLAKIDYFVSHFPHALENNEHKVRWPLSERCDSKTYNPDYWCSALNCFIELVTSKPNISEQGHKWKECLIAGRPLRIFWWHCNEITEEIRHRTFLPRIKKSV